MPITSGSTVMSSFYTGSNYPFRDKTLVPALEPSLEKGGILSPLRKSSTSETIVLISTTNIPSVAISNISVKDDYSDSISSIVMDIFIMILIIPIIVAIILLAKYLRQLKKFQGILNRNMLSQRDNLPANQHELVEFINGQLHEILNQRQRGPNATYAMNPEQLLLVPQVIAIRLYSSNNIFIL